MVPATWQRLSGSCDHAILRATHRVSRALVAGQKGDGVNLSRRLSFGGGRGAEGAEMGAQASGGRLVRAGMLLEQGSACLARAVNFSRGGDSHQVDIRQGRSWGQILDATCHICIAGRVCTLLHRPTRVL